MELPALNGISYPLTFYRVDRQVNSSKNKGGDEMITPIDMRTAYGI
ncbi:hypothetical protein [Mesorhizobium sp. M1A.F.Ca.IN.020.30.1.1]|nr:hypothetical protein [Mesorhizobium sp. M1A.F.Ca.IN.020.30.1.1]